MARIRTLLALLIARLLSRDPQEIRLAGKRLWLYPDGTFMPVIAGGDDGNDEPDEEPDDKKKSTDDDEPDEDKKKDDDEPDEESDDDKVEAGDDWKTKSRKNEARAKRLEKRAKAAEARAKKLEDEGKSDQQKAIDKAKADTRAEVDKERRSDRLEVAATRLAARGFTIGEGDDAETVKFADSDDALVYVERGIRKGEIDEDDIFDDEGKVKTDALQSALGDILEQKEHLRAGAEKKDGKPKGDVDARKGDPAQKDLEAMSPEDHAKRKYGAGDKK